MNRTWIIFVLRVLHPLSWLRKPTLQWCMQEGQVAVVIIAVKSSQNGVTVVGESQGWHCLRQALGTAASGCSRMGVLVSTAWSCPGLWFPGAHSRWGCTQAGCLQEQGLLCVCLSPHRHPWEALSCSILTGCAVLAGLG